MTDELRLPDWAGADYVWVEDRGWILPSNQKKCRRSTRHPCPNPPVADFVRKHLGGHQRWGYCAEHLYGRRIVEGRIFFPVRPDSPAAKRGWV